MSAKKELWPHESNLQTKIKKYINKKNIDISADVKNFMTQYIYQ